MLDPDDEEEEGEDGGGTSAVDGVGEDVGGFPDLVGGEASGGGGADSWAFDEVAGIRRHEPHPDEEPKVAAETGDARSDRDRRGRLAG